MATLPREKLLEYLKHAIELESSLVAQEQIKDTYRDSSEDREPVLCLENYPTAPTLGTSGMNEPSVAVMVVGFGVFAVGVITTLMGLFVDPTGFMDPIMFWFTGFPLGLGGLLGFGPIIRFKQGQRACEKQYQLAYDAYLSKCRGIDNMNDSMRKKYNQDYVEWQASDRKVYSFLDSKRSQTQKALSKLYAKDIIFSKYRNLPALTSIYEYLLSGRCEELTGPNGAYNLYEDELRKDIIIAQLNTIIANLEQIRRNQYTLYEELRKVQNNTARIETELNALKGYTAELTALTALNAYYNGITARTNEIVAFWD